MIVGHHRRLEPRTPDERTRPDLLARPGVAVPGLARPSHVPDGCRPGRGLVRRPRDHDPPDRPPPDPLYPRARARVGLLQGGRDPGRAPPARLLLPGAGRARAGPRPRPGADGRDARRPGGVLPGLRPDDPL